jgi:uncharacterized protein (TIGR03435 family)
MSGTRVRITTCIAVVVVASAPPGQLHAQTPVTGPAFEVASVKLNKSGELNRSSFDIQPNGRLTMTNVPLRRAIQAAFGLRAWQVEAGPDWIDDERFDIIAKAEAPVPAPQLWLMLRTLLADRFKLAVRMQTRDAPVLGLAVARTDGKHGPQLRRSAADCTTLMREAQSDDPNPCGHEIGFGKMNMRGLSIDSLAEMLTAQQTDRSVVNRTGLAGNFDWDLTWTPQAFLDMFERNRREGRPPGEAPLVNGQRVDINGPSLSTALQEQLGLKLESSRGPVEFLEIERVERPADD